MNRFVSPIALSAALLLTFAGCERPKASGSQQPPQGPVPVSAAEVRTGDFPAILEATGQTQAYYTVQVYARVAGYLQKRSYTEGSFVRKGDPLFVLDPSDLKNAYETAQAAYELAVANHANAKAALARIQPLADANAASKQDLDSAVATERTTAATVKSAKASMDQARLNLGYATITAPITGYVDRSKADIGTYIAPGANGLLTTMYQTDPIYVNFTFSENDRIARQNAIAAGRLVPPKDGRYDIELTLGDGTRLSRKGSINFIAPFVDSTTGTITYRAVIDNADHLLLPGQFVRVSVKGMVWKGALYVPQTAMLSNDQGKYVYKIESNNTVTPTVVTPGEWVGENILIDGGIDAGTQIAADNLVKLKPGAEITLSQHP